MEIRVPGDSNYPAAGREVPGHSVDWIQYEAYVFGSLQRLIPGAQVRKDVKVPGMKTGALRQVDVLVERDLGGFVLKIAVDCKCYGMKVNVNDVERFLGMLDDIRVSKGVLMTTKGYTRAALRRAENESRDIELRILTAEQLSEFQGIGGGIPWRGPVAAIVSAPSTWVFDNEHKPLEGTADDSSDLPQFTMYPLGHTRTSALAHGAFIYGGIILKWPEQTIEELAAFHEQRVLERCPDARFERLSPIERKARSERDTGKNILRVGHIHSGYKGPEYTLYLDHPKGVLILVMFCPEGQDQVYVPILKWVGEKVQMMDCEDKRVAPSEASAR
jgi:hypothetical protein